MIRPELKRELESIICRLDEADDSECATKQVLVTVLAAIEARQEGLLWAHVRKFTWALVGALSHRRTASRN